MHVYLRLLDKHQQLQERKSEALPGRECCNQADKCPSLTCWGTTAYERWATAGNKVAYLMGNSWHKICLCDEQQLIRRLPTEWATAGKGNAYLMGNSWQGGMPT